MTRSRPKLHRTPRLSALLFVILALGVRLLYRPIHLAQEDHHGGGGHPVWHSAEADLHGSPEHEGDGEHIPHPALDHAGDLIAPRGPGQERVISVAALPPTLELELPPSHGFFTEPRNEESTPLPPPRRSARPRGPPARI